MSRFSSTLLSSSSRLLVPGQQPQQLQSASALVAPRRVVRLPGKRSRLGSKSQSSTCVLANRFVFTSSDSVDTSTSRPLFYEPSVGSFVSLTSASIDRLNTPYHLLLIASTFSEDTPSTRDSKVWVDDDPSPDYRALIRQQRSKVSRTPRRVPEGAHSPSDGEYHLWAPAHLVDRTRALTPDCTLHAVKRLFSPKSELDFSLGSHDEQVALYEQAALPSDPFMSPRCKVPSYPQRFKEPAYLKSRAGPSFKDIFLSSRVDSPPPSTPRLTVTGPRFKERAFKRSRALSFKDIFFSSRVDSPVASNALSPSIPEAPLGQTDEDDDFADVAFIVSPSHSVTSPSIFLSVESPSVKPNPSPASFPSVDSPVELANDTDSNNLQIPGAWPTSAVLETRSWLSIIPSAAMLAVSVALTASLFW